MKSLSVLNCERVHLITYEFNSAFGRGRLCLFFFPKLHFHFSNSDLGWAWRTLKNYVIRTQIRKHEIACVVLEGSNKQCTCFGDNELNFSIKDPSAVVQPDTKSIRQLFISSCKQRPIKYCCPFRALFLSGPLS